MVRDRITQLGEKNTLGESAVFEVLYIHLVIYGFIS